MFITLTKHRDKETILVNSDHIISVDNSIQGTRISCINSVFYVAETLQQVENAVRFPVYATGVNKTK